MPNNVPVGVAYRDPDLLGGQWCIDGTAVTPSAAELNVNKGVTAGTAKASAAVVLDANKALDVVRTASLRLGTSGSETAVTATAAELNTLHDEIASVTMTSTPASGTCAVQFTFKNAAGAAIGSARRLHFYTSDVNGVPATAVTSYATLTNGTVDTAATGVTGKWGWANTTAAGLLGMTVTASAGTTYVSFVLPNGTIITSGAIVVN